MSTQNRTRIFVVAGLLAIGTVAIMHFSHSREAPAPEPVVAVQLIKAERKPIQQVIATEAVLFSRNQAAITPKVIAPVRRFYVNRGSRVRAGQLLAVLENGDLAAAVTENKGAYEQAQAAYQTTTAANLPEDMKKAELDLKTAREALDAEQKLYNSRQVLFREGALPRKDLDQAAVSLVQAKAQYQLTSQHLAAAKTVANPQGLKSAAGQLASAKGKFQGASTQLGYSQIRSPIDGVVTDRPVYPGETPAAGTPLLTIMDTSSVIAKAHIPQGEAAALHVGDAASIRAPGDLNAKGKVTLISPALDPNSTTVEVWVECPNPQGTLRPGTTVQVEMVAAVEKDAITLPAAALLKTPEGKTNVMVVDAEGVAHEREVETGIHDANTVQITKGLNASETIIATGAYGLPDKTRVKQADAATAAKPEAERE
jgi:multidrug efflux pump subunit AcrA (membrane-fusion protein)